MMDGRRSHDLRHTYASFGAGGGLVPLGAELQERAGYLGPLRTPDAPER
jgi:integrase